MEDVHLQQIPSEIPNLRRKLPVGSFPKRLFQISILAISELANLRGLQVLDLSLNNLSGLIPSVFTPPVAQRESKAHFILSGSDL